MKSLIPGLQQQLKEGVLHEDYVLNSIPRLLNIMREANVTLRWMMLHTSALSPSELKYLFSHFRIVLITVK